MTNSIKIVEHNGNYYVKSGRLHYPYAYFNWETRKLFKTIRKKRLGAGVKIDE
jgi:hypothetical protein